MSTVGLTRTLPTPPRPRERPRARHVREAILSGVALLLVFGVGFLLIKAQEPVEAVKAATPREAVLTTATIRLAPNRHDHCQQLLFDNRTGSIHDAGPAFCGVAPVPPPNTAVGGAITGDHLGRIRDSFRSR